MEEIILNAEIRKELGRAKVKDLRDQGFIPAVLYKQADSTAIKISSGELLRLLHQHRIENAVVSLKFKDNKQGNLRPCLIKEIQYNPVHGDIVHMDFNEISLTQMIKVHVPVTAKGEPVGVKQDGGSLEHVLWEIEVECLPTNIPKEIEVDVSQLKIGDAVHLSDIKLPEGIKPLLEPEAVILHVVAPMKEEVPAETIEGEEKKEPEVIKEKKEAPPEEQEDKEEKK